MNPRARRLAIAGALALLFLIIAALVAAGLAGRCDRAILAALRVAGEPGHAIGPGWLPPLAIGITWLGAAIVRVPVAIAGAAWLLVRRQARAAMVLAATVAIGLLLLPLAKALADRPRPDPAWRLIIVDHQSFPSGHALGAMLLYPLLAALLAGRRAGAAALVLALLIGLSRVYLGVHWASDVAAGWLLGGAGGCAALAFARAPHWPAARRPR